MLVVKASEIRRGELPVNKIVLGDAFEVVKKFPDNSVDAVVTDPPYGLEFMDQEWDKSVPPVEFWREVLRVMKPGAYLLSFFGTRTYHRGVVNIEDAGFEIRDMILWLYGSGMPKSQAVDKLIDKELGKFGERRVVGVYRTHDITSNSYGNWEKSNAVIEVKVTEPATPEARKWLGWGTALKPACEPIVLARKPLSEKNLARNILRWGTGGLNIDACRIPSKDGVPVFIKLKGKSVSCYGDGLNNSRRTGEYSFKGRYPANVVLDEEAAEMLDRQTGDLKSGKPLNRDIRDTNPRFIYGKFNGRRFHSGYGDRGGASRFFYCTKAGRDERFAYCVDCGRVIPQKEWNSHRGHRVVFHTSVKPLKLMEWLVRLVTPPNGIVLDPFFGTGTTGIAALKQGFRFIGVEINEYYCRIAEYRLNPYLAQKRLDVWLQ